MDDPIPMTVDFRKYQERLGVLLISLALLIPGTALTTPPEYKSFHRIQQIQPNDLAPEEEWLEIWVLYIGQGDSILIRLPESLNYDLNGVEERIEILVDGGPGVSLLQFLEDMYPDGTRIEHTVLTHHDSDHVKGLSKVIADDQFGVERIYHNGLASWERGIKEFPPEGQSPRTGKIFVEKRGLSRLEADDITLRNDYFIDGLPALRTAVSSNQLAGVYDEFGRAITSKSTPTVVSHFGHTLRDSGFINEAEGARIGSDLSFDALWPDQSQRRYRGWGYTINGNSLTFKLNYRDFSMLFAGDHNEDSEEDWLELLNDEHAELESDVLKIPHHGSQHNAEEFFDAVNAVIGVASMGEKGFGPRWKHPSEEVIRWMGGSHRVYSTLIHERRFKYEDLDDKNMRTPFFETDHVVIQTDGHWFRVIEVAGPNVELPPVNAVSRGDGTRWIRARD